MSRLERNWVIRNILSRRGARNNRREKNEGKLSASADGLARKFPAGSATGPCEIHFGVDAVQPPTKLFLREGFSFHFRAESLRAWDAPWRIRTECVRYPVAEDVQLSDGHMEERRL